MKALKNWFSKKNQHAPSVGVGNSKRTWADRTYLSAFTERDSTRDPTEIPENSLVRMEKIDLVKEKLRDMGKAHVLSKYMDAPDIDNIPMGVVSLPMLNGKWCVVSKNSGKFHLTIGKETLVTENFLDVIFAIAEEFGVHPDDLVSKE